MDRDAVTARLANYPPERPKRRFTASDVSLILGTALLIAVGTFAAAMGHFAGMLFAVVAAAGVVTVRTSRLGRVNEPVLERFTAPLSVGVSAFVLVYTFGMWRNSPVDITLAIILSAVPVVVYAIHILLMFRTKRFFNG